MFSPKFIYMKIISNIRRVIYNLLSNIVFIFRGIINKFKRMDELRLKQFLNIYLKSKNCYSYSLSFEHKGNISILITLTYKSFDRSIIIKINSN